MIQMKANILIALGSFFALASACCAVRAALLATPFQSTASQKTARLIRMLRDYTWASRGVIEALRSVVHGNASITDNFEDQRLPLANAIKRYLDGSESAESELKHQSMLDFTPEIIAAVSVRAWLWAAILAAVLSAGLQLAAIWV